MLAYANFSAALLAVETLSRVLRHIPEGSISEASAWDFSKLANRANRAEITKAAGTASLIVIASSDGRPSIPASVKNWLRRCGFEQSCGNFAGTSVFDRLLRPGA